MNNLWVKSCGVLEVVSEYMVTFCKTACLSAVKLGTSQCPHTMLVLSYVLLQPRLRLYEGTCHSLVITRCNDSMICLQVEVVSVNVVGPFKSNS